MPPTQKFPQNLVPDEHGIVAVGGTLDADLLIDAYSKGIFPWPQQGLSLPVWFSPNPRGVIPTQQFHLPRSLRRGLRKLSCRWSWNTAFASVIQSCREIARPGQSGTWITEDLMAAYIELFRRKRAYSVECWMPAGGRNEELVAGIYGVWMGKFVSGESMFSRMDNGSKAALGLLGTILEMNGVKFLDTQMVSGVVGAMGGVEIERVQFLDWVREAFHDNQNVPEPDLGAAWGRLLEKC